MAEQLALTLERSPCPGCGSFRHDGCGYDPETVRPAMSLAEALSATIQHAVDTYGWDGARKRLPGLRTWDELTDEERDEALGQTPA